MPKFVRYTAEEWSALYIDGTLDVVGDSYLVDERIAELLGVEDQSSDAFLRGGNTREDVAQTLDELNAWVAAEEVNEANTELAEAEAAAEAARQAFTKAYERAQALRDNA